MNNKSRVAHFIAERISASGKLQKDIAEKAGFEKPNVITMIKQGKTKLPLERVGPIARALEADPVALLHMCLEEYQPETWRAVKPYLQPALSEAERQIISVLRARAGTPFIEALSEESKRHLRNLLDSVRNNEARSELEMMR